MPSLPGLARIPKGGAGENKTRLAFFTDPGLRIGASLDSALKRPGLRQDAPPSKASVTPVAAQKSVTWLLPCSSPLQSSHASLNPKS